MTDQLRVLVTGATGFIGRRTLQSLVSEKMHVSALVRPGKSIDKLGDLADRVTPVRISLDDIEGLKKYLAGQRFDVIVHIGALRGGRRGDRELFERVNIAATEQLALHASRAGARFIFCSSVGVFGAIPAELPANDESPRIRDNLYHTTKIRAEAIVEQLVLEGLDAVIVRPAITYGVGDDGFPHTLINLTAKRRMLLPDRPVKIHLTEVGLLAHAFTRLVVGESHPGKAYIVADPEPVSLHELVNAIHERLYGKPYPRSRTISGRWFDLGAAISRKLKKETWTARFELISRHWYFDVEQSFNDLRLPRHKTMVEFMRLVDTYRREE